MNMFISKALGAMLLAAVVAAIPAASVNEAPKAVRDALTAKFPEAQIKDVEQELENGAVVYEIELLNGADRVEVEVRPDGHLLKIETEIKSADLPKPVADLVADKYPGRAVRKAEKVQCFKSVGEVTTYEVGVEVDGRTIEIEADTDGELLDVDD